MVFTSLNFFLFFPAVCLVYYLVPIKYRYLFLLVASYFFYLNMKPVFGLLLGSITLSTYIFTRLIDKTPVESKKNRYMMLNVILILLPLLFFKYFGAINNEIFHMMEGMHIRYPFPEISLLMPIGISFYTFMAIGYTIDVYNEEIEAEKNLGIVALFISFFPLVLSGPIERAKNMLPQFNAKQPIDYNGILTGLKMMLWGYFMKLVVADRLGIYIDAVYRDIDGNNGSSFILTTILYPFQVYADLGGYSLIAIGTAKALGFDVMHNFRRPFFSVSMSEFWRRWHISLITWITDYVYTPLSFTFRKYGKWGVVIALMLAFMISGIWHGAALTYIAWGLMQGTFLSIEAVTVKERKSFRDKYNLNGKGWFIFICCVFTFLLFAVSQVFGRATTLADALTIYKKMATDIGMPFLDKTTLLIGFCGLAIVMLADFREEYFNDRIKFFDNKSFAVRFLLCLLAFFTILVFGVVSNQFIYFKF